MIYQNALCVTFIFAFDLNFRSLRLIQRHTKASDFIEEVDNNIDVYHHLPIL